MRQLIIAGVLALTAWVAEARADPIQADPGLLDACIARAAGNSAGLDQCRGAMARPCIEAEGVGTMSEVLCWSEEHAAWQEVVASTTERLGANDEQKGARLHRANEAWTAWVDAECSYRSYEFGGGSGEQVDRVRCAADLAADRAISLLAAH